MTIIGAKHIGGIEGKWNIFTDDGITTGKQTISAARYFRKKMKILDRTRTPIIVASAGGCEVIDYITKRIDKELCTKNIDGPFDFQDYVDKAVSEGLKDLKELRGEESASDFCLFILDIAQDELLRVTDLGSLAIDKDVELVEGSGLTVFSELSEDRDFIDRFLTAAEADEFCKPPIYCWDGEKFTTIESIQHKSEVVPIDKKIKKKTK